MIDVFLQTLPGNLIWSSDDAPPNLIGSPMPMGISSISGINSNVREYALPSLCNSSPVQSMSHHGRSCYLGSNDSGYFFAKGIGWTLGTGWLPDHGSIGILPLWAALRERDIAYELNKIGIKTSMPTAIWQLVAIPGPDNTLVTSDTVCDLDGSPACPSLFIYQSKQRWRFADLPFAGTAIKNFVRNNFWSIIMILQKSVKSLHDNGGHDYSISLHNAWVDGSRVDFEYVYLPQRPHRVDALNSNVKEWQSKEKDALHELSYQIAELCDYEIKPSEMAKARKKLNY